jgi:hypothetical protein
MIDWLMLYAAFAAGGLCGILMMVIIQMGGD